VVFAFGGDGVVYDEPGARYLPYIKAWTPETRPVERVLDAPSWAPPKGPTAYVALGLPGPVLGAYAKLGGIPEVQSIVFDIQHPLLVGRCGLIVRGPGATKGTGVEWIAERHGIRLEEVVAVGDWLNDIPMLKAAGRSFAMGQAPDAVKLAATDVLRSDSRTGGGILEAALRSGML
jgi:predicted aconitase with swiveling domain